MPYFPNYVGDHSHLGKVQQPIRCKVWSSLLYETEVGQVHAQVRDAGWITPVQHFAHRSKSAIGTNDGLQFCYRLFDLFKFDYLLPFSTPNYLLLTVFGTLSQVFFSLYTAALVKAAQIWRTPLKLCKHRQISATAVHFSMAATLDAILLLLVLKKRIPANYSPSSFSRHSMISTQLWLPRYDLGGDQSRSIVESLRHLNYMFSPRLLVCLHPGLAQELPGSKREEIDWWTKRILVIRLQLISGDCGDHNHELTRFEWPRIFDGPSKSFARQSPKRITFQCSPCWTWPVAAV